MAQPEINADSANNESPSGDVARVFATVPEQESIPLKNEDEEKNDSKNEDKKKKVQFNREDIKHKDLTTKAKMGLKPHKGQVTRDYFNMIHNEKKLKDQPVWDKSQNTLTLSMIESRRNVFTSEKLLNEKRSEFRKYCENRDKQINDLMNKERKLRESFEFFDEFVQENIEKRERAENKIVREKETRKKIVENIDKVNERLVHVNKLKEKMIKSIEENKVFQDYLIKCGKALPQIFSSRPEKIIERYHLLTEVRNELISLQRREIEKLQETSNLIDTETEDRSEQLIDLNNLLTDLYNRKQIASQEVWSWKIILNKLQSDAAQRMFETEQAQAACDDLYAQVCRDIDRPVDTPLSDKNSEQMRIILEQITELHQIVRVARERAYCNYSNRPNSRLSRPRREKPKPRTRP